MRIVLGVDHAGFPAKHGVLDHLAERGCKVTDVGAWSEDAVDFPEIAKLVCSELLLGRADRGLLVCGTGIGASIAANKVRGIRAALAHDCYSAHQCVEHDDANVLCVGSQIVGREVMRELIDRFLTATFIRDAAFTRRVAKIAALEDWLPE